MARLLPLLFILGLSPLMAQELHGPDLTDYEVLAEALEKGSIPGLVVLDVRPVEEYNAGHIPGALSFPLLVPPGETSPLYRDFPSKNARAPLVVYGRPASPDSRKAADILRTRNYQNVIVFGSVSKWLGPLQKTEGTSP